MTPRKLEKLQRVLGEWPTSRQIATVRQVSGLTGFSLACVVCLAAREVLRRSVAGCDGHASIGRFSVWFGQPEEESHVGPSISQRARILAVVCGQKACLSRGTLFVAHVQHHSPTKTTDVHGRFQVGLRRVLSSDRSFLSSRTVSRREVSFLRFEQTLYWL